MFEAGFTSLLTMEGCSFGCQVLRCSLQAPCVTHGAKYAILGCDSLTYFRSCEAGQGKGKPQSVGLRAAFKSSVAVPSRCFRAWFGCSRRDGWCHLRSEALKPLRCPHVTEPLWETHALLEQQPVHSGVSISNGSEYLHGGYSAELLLSLYCLTLMEQTLTWVVDKNKGVPGRKWGVLCAREVFYLWWK